MTYKVSLYSKPSPGLTHYDGTVTVHADNADDARRKAIEQMNRNPGWKSHRGSWVATETRAVG